MAIKVKNEKKQNKLIEILTTEYKWENLLLGVLATVSAAFAVMIITGILVVNRDFPVIGDYPMVFAWLLLVISIVGILLVVYPFFLPALPELKKVTWATRPVLLDAAVRVFLFMIFLALVFLFYDFVIVGLLGQFPIFGN